MSLGRAGYDDEFWIWWQDNRAIIRRTIATICRTGYGGDVPDEDFKELLKGWVIGKTLDVNRTGKEFVWPSVYSFDKEMATLASVLTACGMDLKAWWERRQNSGTEDSGKNDGDVAMPTASLKRVKYFSRNNWFLWAAAAWCGVLGAVDFYGIWIYQLSRWAVCAAAVGGALRATGNWGWPLWILAVIYNPIAPIHFDDGEWVFVNWISAVGFLAAAVGAAVPGWPVAGGRWAKAHPFGAFWLVLSAGLAIGGIMFFGLDIPAGGGVLLTCIIILTVAMFVLGFASWLNDMDNITQK